MADEKIFQVSEFNEFIDILVSQQEVIVEGEITEINVSRGQWVFITVKDQESNLEIFSMVHELNTLDLLEEGMLVHVYGTPHLHRKSGRFRLHAYQILPAGEGQLRIAFEKLKLQMEKEGLFAPERKRPLPLFPQNIGLLTAKNSAAYSDFVKVLTNRMGGMKIYFLPVSVQGVHAIKEVAQGIEYLNAVHPSLDLIIVTRGGGSLEDLQAFNSEEVAHAIFASKIPMVSAIGHEKDWTIADLVADVRASTPSNAAELLVREKEEVLGEVVNLIYSMNLSLIALLEEKRNRVNDCLRRIEFTLKDEIERFQSMLYRFKAGFIKFSGLVKNTKRTIEGSVEKMTYQESLLLETTKSWYNKLINLLRTLDYQNILNRGFSITFTSQGKILKKAESVKPKEKIKTKVSNGEIISIVK